MSRPRFVTSLAPSSRLARLGRRGGFQPEHLAGEILDAHASHAVAQACVPARAGAGTDHEAVHRSRVVLPAQRGPVRRMTEKAHAARTSPDSRTLGTAFIDEKYELLAQISQSRRRLTGRSPVGRSGLGLCGASRRRYAATRR